MQLLRPLWEGSRLVPVPAQLAESDRSDADGPGFALSYRYELGGETFTSSRLTFDSTFTPTAIADQAGEQRKLHERFASTLTSGGSVTAWVDPEQPAFAVLDKTPRWRAIIVLLPFVLVMPYLAWRLGLVTRRLLGGSPPRPDSPPARRGGENTWPPILLFCLITFVLVVLAWRESPGSGLSLVVSALAFVALALAWSAIRRARRPKRLGSSHLESMPHPLTPGCECSTQLRWQTTRRDADVCLLRLSCLRLVGRGDDESATLLWHDERLVRAAALTPAGEMALSARWLLPSDLPASSVEPGVARTLWRLSATDLVTGDGAHFDLPVAPAPFAANAAAISPRPLPDLAATPAPEDLIPPSLLNIEAQRHGCLVRFPPTGFDAINVALFFAALAAAGFVAYVLVASPPQASAMALAMAAAASIGLMGLALFFATHAVEVILNPHGLHMVHRSLLWQWQRSLPLARIEAFAVEAQRRALPRGGDLSRWQVVAREAAGQTPRIRVPAIESAAIASTVALTLSDGLTRARSALRAGATGTRFVPPRRSRYAAPLGVLLAGIYVLAAAIAGWNDARRQSVHLSTDDGPRVSGQRITDPLHEAALADDVPALEALLAGGADANQSSADGTTPLHYAALAGNTAVAALLLRHGANADAQKRLTASGGGETALMYAADKPALARILLDAGANPELGDRFGRTAIHWAARMDSSQTMALLRERGVSIDAAASGPGGETPLMMAIWFSAPGAIQWLDAAGADPAKPDARGRGIEHYASGAANEALSRQWVERLRAR